MTMILIVIDALGKRAGRGLKLEDESRPFKLKHCWDQTEYWEES